MSLQIRDQLENVNDMVDEIEVTSQAQANEEVMTLVDTINADKDWDVQIAGMNKAMQLIKGGLLNYKPCLKELSRISSTLVSGSRNLRSALVKTSTLLLAQMAKELREEFDIMGEVIQPLSTQTSHGTQIIADSCRYTILVIVQNVPTIRTLRAVFDLAGSRAGPNRQTAAEGLGIALREWKGSVLDKNAGDVAATIVKLATDAQAETRQFARAAAAGFIAKYPARKGEILERVDERTKAQIATENVKPPELTSEIAKPAPAEGEPPKKRKSLLPTAQRTVKTAGGKKKESAVVKRESEMPPPRLPRKSSPPSNAAPARPATATPYQRRSKSPEQKRQQKPVPEKQVVDEETDAFLLRIEEYVNTNRQFLLESEMKDIAARLLEYSTGNNEELQKRAEPLIEILLPTFPPMFEGAIAVLFKTYFETNENIINSLVAQYDSNKILAVAIEHPLSPALIDLFATLCGQKDIMLTDTPLCEKLIDAAVNNKSPAAEKIILAIKRQNPDLVLASNDNYVISVVQSVGPPEYPPFDPHNVTRWCASVKQYVSALPRGKWLDECDSLYHEIVSALDMTNEKVAIFALIQTIMKAQGPDSVNILVVSFISYWRSKYAPNLPQILKFVVKNGDNVVLIRSILSYLEDPELTRPALDLLTEVITLCKEKQRIQSIVPAILEQLQPHMCDEATDVRKSTVFCYVAVSVLFKPEVDKAIQQLTQAQQKLIALYRQTKR